MAIQFSSRLGAKAAAGLVLSDSLWDSMAELHLQALHPWITGKSHQRLATSSSMIFLTQGLNLISWQEDLYHYANQLGAKQNRLKVVENMFNRVLPEEASMHQPPSSSWCPLTFPCSKYYLEHLSQQG